MSEHDNDDFEWVAVAISVHGAMTQSTAEKESEWRQRAQFVLQKNPLYGRTIVRSELPVLIQQFKVSRSLPVASEGAPWIAYLIQGEEDITDKAVAMWDGGVADVFLLTFNRQRHYALFFPNSLLAEGRNVLLGAAAFEETRRKMRYILHFFRC